MYVQITVNLQMSVPVQNVCKSKLHVCMGCCLKANNRRLSKILNVATLKSKISSWKALGFLLLRVQPFWPVALLSLDRRAVISGEVGKEENGSICSLETEETTLMGILLSLCVFPEFLQRTLECCL